MHCDADPSRPAQRGDAGRRLHPPSLWRAGHRLGARDRGLGPRGRARLLSPILHPGERDPHRRRRRRAGRGAAARRAALRHGPARTASRRSAGARSEPKPVARRFVEVTDDKVEQPAWQRVYLCPSHATAAPGESEALEVLAHLLGGGATSYRLPQAGHRGATRPLARAPITPAPRSTTRVSSSTACRPRTSACRSSTPLSTLRLTASSPRACLPRNLERGKTRLIAEAVYAQDSQATLARWYGASLATGQTIADVQGWPARIEAVTAARWSQPPGLGSTAAAPSPAFSTHPEHKAA